jgi:hypothetical protein
METGMGLILVLLFSWLATLSGVALGGFLVYRTKRDSFDPLFSKPEKGEAFNIVDPFNMQDVPSATRIPPETREANDRFLDQFADEVADRAAGGKSE